MIGTFHPFVVIGSGQPAAVSPVHVKSTGTATEIASKTQWLANNR